MSKIIERLGGSGPWVGLVPRSKGIRPWSAYTQSVTTNLNKTGCDFQLYFWPCVYIYFFFYYRQTGWIGTVEVNRDMGLEPGETQRQNVFPFWCPDSPLLSQSTPLLESTKKLLLPNE